jgi:hypothetical protein
MIPNEGILQFSTPQRSLIFQAMDEAEIRTSNYYCIPPFRWEQMRFDVLTRADYGWEPIPDLMLARMRCLKLINPANAFDFYRIELNDGSILTAAQREDLTDNLYPFFVYILTHELVHMVRLSTIFDFGPDTPILSSEMEEQRVQRISHKILTNSPKLQPVLEKFCG